MSKEMTYVLGVDVSTQSVTTEVYSLAGERITGAREPLPATFPPISEHDPQWWWNGFCTNLQTLRNSGLDLKQVVAISVASQCHGLVVLDRTNQVIRPAKLWNDTTSVAVLPKLQEVMSGADSARRLGINLNPAHTLTKLLWLREKEPHNFAKIRHVLLPHDYLNFLLTGKYVTDRSQASGTGYWSAVTEEYDEELLDWMFTGHPASKQESLVPTVLGPDQVAGKILPELAAVLGLNPEVIIAAGGGDQHLGALGIGLADDDICLSLGTSGVVMGSTRAAITDITGWVDGVCNTWGGWLPLVCTLNAAKVTDKIAELLAVSYDEYDQLALAALELIKDGNYNLNLVPYFDGERSPSKPHATGIISGITSRTTRADLAISGVLGVAFGMYRGQLKVEEVTGQQAQKQYIVGGGAKSSAYRQVFADLTGRPVYTVDAPEATARGACLQSIAVATNVPVAVVKEKYKPRLLSETKPLGIDLRNYYASYCELADSI